MIIESYIDRPAKELPQEMAQEIRDFKPNVSIYAAQGQSGELPVFRAPLKDVLVYELNCRHAHMIGITKQLMEDGMNKDYDLIYKVTKNVKETVEKAAKFKVTDPHGTNIEFELDNANLKWIAADGKISTPGKWSNLPDGEAFTCPKNVNGTIVAWVLGDDLMKYGELASPLKVDIKDSYITDIKAVDPTDAKTLEAVSDLKAYVAQETDSNRVGELGIGTLIGLEHFVGNLLQDEKFPGIHVAFGHPYPHETGATWDCESHIDVIAKKTTITAIMADGSEQNIMSDGKFEDRFTQ
jgi:leucyl aminopeptidase (aminopeptidase T)